MLIVKKQRVPRNLPAKELKPRLHVLKAAATGAEKPARSEPTMLKLKLLCCLSANRFCPFLLAKNWKNCQTFSSMFSREICGKLRKVSVNFFLAKIWKSLKDFVKFFLANDLALIGLYFQKVSINLFSDRFSPSLTN